MVEAGSLRPARVSSQQEMAPGIYLLSFPRNLDFEAGQVISLALEKDGARRLYSICSGEQDPEIGILYNVVEEGYLTPKLSDVKKGDELWYSEARGEFTCGTEAAVWIAAGTGIAPFYAMLRSGKAPHNSPWEC